MDCSTGRYMSLATDHASGTLTHTLAHLGRLDLLIWREVLAVRQQQPQQSGSEFRGLYISEEDVDALLNRSLTAAGLLSPVLPAEDVTVMNTALAVADRRIADVEAAAFERHDVLRLDHLSRAVGLSSFERDVLVVALAAELDLKYERLFGYLQDDVTKKRPTVDLVLRLLCPTLPDRLAARSAFRPDAPLLRWELIALHEDPGSRHPVLLARYLKLDERIASYLLSTDARDADALGVHAIDARLAPFARPVPTDDAVLPPEVRERLSLWAHGWMARWQRAAVASEAATAAFAEAEPIVLVHGRYGTGRRAAAAFLASSLDRPCLLLDLSHRCGSELELRQIVSLAEREALLTGALICWYQVDEVLHAAPDRQAEQRVFFDSLAHGRALTLLLAEKLWEPARSLERRPFYRLELTETTYAEREARWTSGLEGVAAGLGDRDVSALAGRFRLTIGQIEDALARARTLAWTRDPANGQVTVDDIDAACRTQAQHRLDSLARKLTPRYHWDDIVLPPRELNTLRLIGSMIRQRSVVYGQWRFDRKLAMGKGVMAMFAGPSGTGKTMAAEVIARDLGLDIYKIDLSAVVNKYIGETEKNLERLFAEAQHSDAILFFDEADALFGKRSEVSDAHDRYANIETAYLLQRTEEYDGLVILASNLPKSVDEAFARRLHFSVVFREPDEAERLAIWQRTFSPEAPVADDVDLPVLARKFKLSGGNIRNIVLAAAFLAAEERTPIAMRHLMAATAQEFQKLGRMRLESEIGADVRSVRT